MVIGLNGTRFINDALEFVGNCTSVEPEEDEPKIPEMLIENGIMYLLAPYLESDSH